MGVGTLLYFWCAFESRAADHGAPAATRPATPRFVASGPYLFVRSPMYIGGLAILVGHALWFEAPALLPYIAVAFATAHLFILLYEEPLLTRRFGADYRDYLDSVPRWIPRTPPTGDER
jgi:protein-S-isoprenylcysteine O-methyltransferase Ste14